LVILIGMVPESLSFY